MHHGRFPPHPEPRPAGLQPALVTRRQFVIGVGAFAIGAAVGTTILARGQPAEPAPRVRPSRGTLDWALWMGERSDDELLAAAGDLERVSMRHRDAGLVTVFYRLLDLALQSRAAEADAAGACAIRSLARLDAFALAIERRADIEARGDLTDLGDAFARAAERHRKRRD